MSVSINTAGNWRIWWGPSPLPHGAEARGTVRRDAGDEGALLEMATDIFAQGNAGVLRSLPQREIHERLYMAKIGSAGGSQSSPAKRRSAKRNGRKGGRPERGES